MHSRLTLILHPNPTCAAIVLNDHLINKEQYMHTRKLHPVGGEKKLLEILNTSCIGVSKAQAAKNEISLDLVNAMLPCEWFPAVLTAVLHYVRESAPEYTPVIYLDDRRYSKAPVYEDDETGFFPRTIEAGIKVTPGTADIGVEYVPCTF